MTRPAPLPFEEQRDLTRKIDDLLVTRAPADRDQIRVMYRAAGDHEEMVGHILGVDGQLREWEAPPELAELYRRLRAGFGAMSLRAERERQGPYRYRVRRELRTLCGQAVPWHDQPGGGTGYLLPKSVEQHTADGSLAALVDPSS
jgi:hypothetical protein